MWPLYLILPEYRCRHKQYSEMSASGLLCFMPRGDRQIPQQGGGGELGGAEVWLSQRSTGVSLEPGGFVDHAVSMYHKLIVRRSDVDGHVHDRRTLTP